METIRRVHISNKAASWLIFGAALAVRLAAVILSNLIPALRQYALWGDAVGYTQLAVNLLAEGNFRFFGGAATAFRMPGYPLFLALTYATNGSPIPTQLLQVASDLVVMLLVLRIVEFLFKDWLIGWLAAAVIAFHPVLILSTITLYPESLGVLFTTLALFLLLKFDGSLKSGLLAGAALSVAIYLKTNLLTVAGLMVLVVGLRSWFSGGIWSSLRATMPAVLLIGLTLLPWVIRNWLVMDAFIPTTTSNGVNMYRGNNPLADGGAASNQPYVLAGMSEVQSSREFSRQAWEWMWANPVQALRLLPAKAGRFVWPLALAASGTIQVNPPVFGLVLLLTLLFYGLAATGAWVAWRSGLKWELLLLLAPLTALFLLSLLSYGAVRFSLPAVPGLAVLTSVGFVSLLKRKTPLLANGRRPEQTKDVLSID